MDYEILKRYKGRKYRQLSLILIVRRKIYENVTR